MNIATRKLDVMNGIIVSFALWLKKKALNIIIIAYTTNTIRQHATKAKNKKTKQRFRFVTLETQLPIWMFWKFWFAWDTKIDLFIYFIQIPEIKKGKVSVHRIVKISIANKEKQKLKSKYE